MKPLLRTLAFMVAVLGTTAPPLKAQAREAHPNPPPRFFDEIESPIFVPQLLLGVRF